MMNSLTKDRAHSMTRSPVLTLVTDPLYYSFSNLYRDIYNIL